MRSNSSTGATMGRTIRNSLPSLWEQAVTLWRELVLGFGHPHDLIRWGWMRALEHRALGGWLRELEALVRRAIRADAAELDLPAPDPRAPGPRPGPPQSRDITSNDDMPRFRRPYGDDCTTWKVSFRMSAARPGKHQGARTKEGPAEKRRCRGYAFRIEALRRVISRREDYVLRYARRLARAAFSAMAAMREMHAGRHACDPPQPAAAVFEATQTTARPIEPG